MKNGETLGPKPEIELLHENWYVDAKDILCISIPKINGILIGDSKSKLVSILEREKKDHRIFPITEFEIYICDEYEYKLKENVVIGFALFNKSISKDDIIRHFGVPGKKMPVIGEIWSMDMFELEANVWEYPKLNLRISFDRKEENATAFHFGKQSHQFDY